MVSGAAERNISGRIWNVSESQAKEFSFELIEQKSREPSIEARIAVHFERMEMVIESLCTLDSHIRQDFEFRKPEGIQQMVSSGGP